ncbi:MAG: hypothetical protein GY750_20910 [Lentisphaerae bacterium]|nr:hypothetical protein [Lentisphaerota bacterium]
MEMPQMETKMPVATIEPMSDFDMLRIRIMEKGLQTDEEAYYAESQLVYLKQMMKEIEDHHSESIDKANQTHKSMIKARDKFLKPLKDAEKIIKKAVGSYCLEEHAKGVSVSKKVKAEIVDVDSIPEEFLELKPNLKAIEAILNAGGTVAGVKPIENNTVRVKA